MSSALRTAFNLRAAAAAARPLARAQPAARTISNTAPARFAYKDSQDRETLKPGGTEGTKTGRDSEVAHDKAAFDPSTTRPESERDEGGNVLNVSGANQEASKPQGDHGDGERSVGKETRKGGKSAGGDSPKAGKV
ncbi:hypothetical protein CCHL11_04083 [Colletotrichum chlorophyti]|uniref:Uncharacterized protein n=1 Tax=Colletotrichum chlorophyti TaxID=708187 RepID=A0A1Q8RPC3_9PEZI|nr:hypothetical protein CCHL11_04083 [Colletotrichum chlorophyti]